MGEKRKSWKMTILANVQPRGGTSFSHPLNKCCNYLHMSVVTERNLSATEAPERLMASSHTAAYEVSLCRCYNKS